MLRLPRPPVPALVATPRSESRLTTPILERKPDFPSLDQGRERTGDVLFLLDDEAHAVMHQANLIAVTGEPEPGTVLINRGRRQFT